MRNTSALRIGKRWFGSFPPKRFELLRHVHQHPAKTIRALALTLGRDYRRVHKDVEALEAAGLLDRDKEGVRAEYDAFDVRMRVAL